MGSIDGDGNWPIVLNLALEVVLTAGSDVDITLDPEECLRVLIRALVGDSLVRVVVLGHDLTVLEVDDVLERHEHETAVAALVIGIAVDKVGLGHGDELVVLRSPGTLDRADGRESPAGAAAALVLDTGDGALLPPVEGLGIRHRGAAGASRDSNGLAEAEEGAVLSRGKSSELVHLELESGRASVVALDGAKVSEPDTKADVVLVASENLVRGAHPRNERALLVRLDEDASRKRKQCKHVK